MAAHLWIGPGGRSYDAVGAGLKSKYFNYEGFTNQISGQLGQQGVTVAVDLRRLNCGERFAVDHCIRGLDDAHRSRITVLK